MKLIIFPNWKHRSPRLIGVLIQILHPLTSKPLFFRRVTDLIEGETVEKLDRRCPGSQLNRNVSWTNHFWISTLAFYFSANHLFDVQQAGLEFFFVCGESPICKFDNVHNQNVRQNTRKCLFHTKFVAVSVSQLLPLFSCGMARF